MNIHEKHRAGLSIVEMVVSMFLLFLASSFLMGMFLVANGAPKRTDRAAELDQVASFKMDEVLVAPLGTVPSQGSGTFADFPGFTYTVTTASADFDPDSDADNDMLAVTVVAKSPDGQTRRLVALKPKRKPVPPPPPPPETAFDLKQWDIVAIDPDNDDEPPEPPPILPPPAALISQGCLDCHSDQYATAPLFGINNIEASARASGKDPVTYVKESISDPGAYVVPGYGYPSDPNDPNSPENSQMEGFGDGVTPAEAEQIANWILSGMTNYDAPYPPTQSGETPVPSTQTQKS